MARHCLLALVVVLGLVPGPAAAWELRDPGPGPGPRRRAAGPEICLLHDMCSIAPRVCLLTACRTGTVPICLLDDCAPSPRPFPLEP